MCSLNDDAHVSFRIWKPSPFWIEQFFFFLSKYFCNAFHIVMYTIQCTVNHVPRILSTIQLHFEIVSICLFWTIQAIRLLNLFFVGFPTWLFVFCTSSSLKKSLKPGHFEIFGNTEAIKKLGAKSFPINMII